jgi:fibronectin-binding autotransporter adhesin
MKTKLNSSALTALNLAAALFTLTGLSAFAAGTTYYWDCTSPINATGFGTASGTWGTDSFLTTSATGVTTPGSSATAAADTLQFGTGSSTYGLATGTIGVNGTVLINNLTVGSQSGAITLGSSISSGTISITNGAANPVFANNSTSLFTINSDVTNSLSSSATLAFAGTANGGDFLMAGVVSGPSCAITKRSAGTLTLNNANNSYGGTPTSSTTTVQAGTLVAGGNVPASGNGVFGSATTAILVGNGSTAAADAPTLLIGGGNSVARQISIGTSLATAYTATIGTINSGTANITGIMALSAANPTYNTILQAVPGGTLDFNTGTWQNSGNHPVTIGSAGNTGTVKVENQMQGLGNVTVNAGTLQVTYSGGFGAAVYSTLNYGIGGTVTPSGSGITTATLDLNSAGSAVTHDYPLTLNGNGNTAVLVNSAPSTTTTLSYGKVKGVPITAGGSSYNTADTIAFSGGGGNSATASLGFGFTTATIPAANIGGTWSVGNTLTVGGGGSVASAVLTITSVSGTTPTGYTLTSAGSGFTSFTSPVLTYTGAKGSASTAPTVGTVTPVNGTLTISGVKVTASGSGYTSAPSTSITTSTGSGATFGTAVLNSLALVGTGNQIGSGTDGNLTVQCPVTDGGSSGGFTKAGSGTLTLSAANTYSGDTTISAGTLKLDAAGAIPNSPNIIVGSGGTLDVSTKTVAMALSGQKLKASATGANTGTINLAASHGLTLDATAGQGLEFTAYGGSTAPLTLSGSGGNLVLNSAPIKVTTTSALAAGPYTLIAHGGSATVNGTPGTFSTGGSGLASGATGTLSVNGSGDLILSLYYTVTFDPNDGDATTSGYATNGLTYGTLPTPTRSGGYVFSSWNTAADGSGATITAGTSVNITAPQTLYAKWTAPTTPTKLVITSVPSGTTAAGNTFSVTVQAQDGSGNPGNVTSATGISLAASGSGTLAGNTATIPSGQNSVTLTGVTYTKAEAITLTASQTSGTPTLSTSAASSSFTVVPNVASAANSTVVASPASLAADNSSLSTVTATLQDAYGNLLAGSNVTWSATGTGNTLSPASSGTANGSGVASFTIKSTKAEAKTVTVQVGSTVVTNSLTINFTNPTTGNSFVWDPSNNGSGSDAAGTWDTSTANWASGSADFAWPNNGSDNATFGSGAALGANYTVSLGTGITVGNLTNNTSGANQYTIGTSAQTLTLAGTTPTVSVAGSMQINSMIAGTAGLTKTGSGTLWLNASNSFSGGLVIKNGTLAVTTNPGKTATLGGNGTGAVTLGDAAGGPAALLLGWQAYNNPITLGAGAVGPLTIGDCLDDAGANQVTVNGGINLNGNNLNIIKTVGGNNLTIGNLAITGTGSLTLSNLNSTAAGTISVSAPVNLTGSITNIGTGTNATTISGNLAPTVTAVIQNSATAGLTLSGSNTFSGGLYINAGTVTASTSTNALGGSGLGTVYLGDTSGSADATLKFNYVLGGFANPITVQSGSSGNTLTISATGYTPLAGAITQNNPFTVYPVGAQSILFNGQITGSSQITVTNDTGTGSVVFNADNHATWTGPLVVKNGTFRTQKSTALGANNTVQVNSGAIFDTYFQFPTIAGLNDNGSGAGGLVTNVFAGYTTTLTVGGSGTYSFAGVIGDGGGANKMALTMAGSGTQTLGGINTYSGATTIGGGTLALGASGSINNSTSLSIAAGATFDVSAIANYTLSGSTTVTASGAASAATIKGGTTVSLGSQGVTLNYDGSHAALTVSQGTLSLSGNQFTVVVTNTALTAGTYTLVSTPNAISGTVNATPLYTGGNGVAAGYTGVVSKSGNNVILTVTPNNYTLTYTAGAHGTISGTTSQTVAYLSSGSAVTATPSTGYHFTGWNDGVATASRTDTALIGGTNVTANFAINSYTLTYNTTTGGTISGTTSQTVNYGGNGSTVTAVPDAGNHFTIWSDGVATAARTDTGIVNNTNVTANFATNTYNLVATSDAHGTVTPAGTTVVNYNGGQAYTITADASYNISDVLVDSVSQGPISTYTFSSVTANHTISASFVLACTAPVIVGGISNAAAVYCAGDAAVLTLTNVTGTSPLYYQWQTNNVNILNATNAAYTNSAVATADGLWNYTCYVSNACGSVTSSVVNLTVKHPPVANTLTLVRTAGTTYTLRWTDLATNWSSPDGDPVTLASFNRVTTNGWTLATNGAVIKYTNSSVAVADQFSYTVSSGYCGTTTGYVNLVINPFTSGQAITGQASTNTPSGPFTVKYWGIPGYTYQLQRNTNLSAGFGWKDISTNTIGSSGYTNVLDDFSDLGAVPGSAYYRVGWHP